eukprot:COSAG02_NODE_299_length_25349_cov_53.762020_5_plen_90_part_00
MSNRRPACRRANHAVALKLLLAGCTLTVHRDTTMAAPASSRADLAVAGAPARPVERAQALVKRMNATEKYQLLSGVWGLGWAPPEEQVS